MNRFPKQFKALGRLKPGVMNKTEQRYADRLELLKKAGEILDWKFDSMKLRLADKTFYETDFLVVASDFTWQVHEVKGGFITDDAAVKLKVAASLYPYLTFFKCQYKGSQWTITEH